jgi:16S rRNA (cytosine1402-N4)-methyltransferase
LDEGPAGDHQTVLLEEAVTALVTDSNGFYVDGTFGRGGHTRALLERLGPEGRVLALDLDPQACRVGTALAARDSRLEMVQMSFRDLLPYLATRPVPVSVAGLLLDLGVSSPQLDDPARGFSFLRDGDLDMRMNPDQGQSAAAWLAAASETEITRVLQEYGEERYARRIARAIVQARAQKPLLRTVQLAKVIAEAHPAWQPGRHPATQSFQAIRIHINGELTALRAVLDQVLEIMAIGGRLVVISFHSLEDRMVKRFIRDAEHPRVPRGLPIEEARLPRRLRALGRAIHASATEVAANPRARSAVMRVAEKLA